MSQNPVCGIQILSSPHSIRTYLSSAKNESGASCAMNVMNANCANSAHLHPFVHSKAAPESETVPAQ